MGDKKMIEKFDVTEEQLDTWASEYESTDWSSMEFGKVVQGRPRISDEELKTITLRIPASRVAAVQRAADREGITRSEFVRKAIENELIDKAM